MSFQDLGGKAVGPRLLLSLSGIPNEAVMEVITKGASSGQFCFCETETNLSSGIFFSLSPTSSLLAFCREEFLLVNSISSSYKPKKLDAIKPEVLPRLKRKEKANRYKRELLKTTVNLFYSC
jgi:hypothetical protein